MACLIPDRVTFYNHWRYDDFSQTDDVVSGSKSPTSPMSCMEDSSYWSCIWKLVGKSETLEPDKELLRSLQQIRAHLSGDVLDIACSHLRTALLASGPSGPGTAASSSPALGSGVSIVRKLEAGGSHHIRTVLKNLVMLGSNLSQSREFRDLFEDIMTKIGEVLEEDGLNLAESVTFLRCCSLALNALEGSRVTARLPDMKREWQRFLHCCRLCLVQLFSSTST